MTEADRVVDTCQAVIEARLPRFPEGPLTDRVRKLCDGLNGANSTMETMSSHLRALAVLCVICDSTRVPMRYDYRCLACGGNWFEGEPVAHFPSCLVAMYPEERPSASGG